MKLYDIEKFKKMIPRTIPENLEFRKDLHEQCSKDKAMQEDFKEMCRQSIDILFDTCLWTFNPRNPRGFRNIPFILRPQQTEVVLSLDKSIYDGEDAGIEKSRDEGATEIITKLFAGRWLLDEESIFLMGSRKAEYVDKGVEVIKGKVVGAHKCLFHKVMYGVVNLPLWLRPKFNKTYMMLQNLDNSSVISGESTNDSLGAGDRATAIFIDEHGAMEDSMASSILDVVHDVTDCLIVASTHYKGISHPFCKYVRQEFGEVNILRLEWWRNPAKNAGLYRSPDYDVIEITDINYYKNKYPEIFKDVESYQPLTLSSLKNKHKFPDNLNFVADGGDENEGGFRSPWYDKQAKKRSKKDVAQNLDIRPIGTGAAVFDPTVIHRIRQQYVRPANHFGDIKVQYTKETHKVCGGEFIPYHGKRKLNWWGPLYDLRPDQTHNYIVACDISTGAGTSNSVAKILDVNTNEEVGSWVCPDTPVESFADVVIALCKWVGGFDDEPFLIWEANGIGGSFTKRVKFTGYGNYYIRRDERSMIKKSKNVEGWWNDDQTKEDLCHELNIALRYGVDEFNINKKILLHCEETVKELSSYLFLEGGHIGPTSIKNDPSGARKRHGDRVIATGLAVLALEYRKKAMVTKSKRVVQGSFMERYLESLNETSERGRFSSL